MFGVVKQLRERKMNRAANVRDPIFMRRQNVNDLSTLGDDALDFSMIDDSQDFNLRAVASEARQLRQGNIDDRLAASGSDARGVNFVTTFAVRLMRRNVSDQIVAVPDNKRVTKIWVGTDGEAKLDERLAGNSDERGLADRDDRQAGRQLSAIHVNSAIAPIGFREFLDRMQRFDCLRMMIF